MFSLYPRARRKRRRKRKRRKPLNCKTQNYPPTGSSPSPQEPSTFLVERESHRLAHHLPHPPMLHLPHVLDLPGFRLLWLKARIVEAVLGLHFQMGWTVGQRSRLGLGRKGKRGTNMRIHHLPKGGSTGLHPSRSAPVFCFLCVMAKRTLNVSNTPLSVREMKRTGIGAHEHPMMEKRQLWEPVVVELQEMNRFIFSSLEYIILHTYSN